MGKPEGRQFLDESSEMLICSKKTVVHDIKNNRYYQVSTNNLSSQLVNESHLVFAKASKNTAWLTVLSTLLLLSLNLGFAFNGDMSHTTNRLPVIFILYITISVILHEGAHIIALKLCGRDYDKFGFKLHYAILPAFYVRMNASHMLLWTDKVIVHCAGIWTNLALNLALFVTNREILHSPDLQASLQFAVITLAANALPALNSDGFRVLMALCQVNEFKERHRNPLWIRAIRVISWILVIVYGFYVTISFCVEVWG